MFLACARGGTAEHLARLRALAAAGATTSAFHDHELGPENFATAVIEFLDARQDAEHFLSAAAVVMTCGDAHLTNRGYVGNGGAPAIYFVLDCLAGHRLGPAPQSTPAPEHARGLLRLLIAHGVDLGQHFWPDFVGSLRPLPEPAHAWGTLQREVVALAEARGAFVGPAGAWTETAEDRALRPLWHLFRVQRLDVLEWLVECATRSDAVRALVRSGTIDELTGPLLDRILGSQAGRRLLLRLGARSALVFEWLCRPATVLRLAAKSERRTIEWLLARAPRAVVEARDAQGRSALHTLVRQRGRVERLLELLVDAGLDPHADDHTGESALALARRLRRTAAVAQLQAPTCDLADELAAEAGAAVPETERS